MNHTVVTKLNEQTRQNLRIIAEEKYDGEITANEALEQLTKEEVAELEETKEAIEAKQEDLAESFGNGEDTTPSKESTSDDSEVAEKQAEVASKFFNGGQQ